MPDFHKTTGELMVAKVLFLNSGSQNLAVAFANRSEVIEFGAFVAGFPNGRTWSISCMRKLSSTLKTLGTGLRRIQLLIITPLPSNATITFKRRLIAVPSRPSGHLENITRTTGLVGVIR